MKSFRRVISTLFSILKPLSRVFRQTDLLVKEKRRRVELIHDEINSIKRSLEDSDKGS